MASRPLALVTGASDGIGWELARALAERGHDLVICAEDAGIVEARQAFEQLGAKVEAVQADLRTRDGVEKVWARTVALGRPLAVACLNAGVGVGGAFVETDLDAELAMVQLNCASTVHLAKRVAKDMAARREGRILFTSSIAATMPAPFEAVYGATKAFVQNLAQGLRNELADHDVVVTALQPGPTDTNFFHRAGMDDTKVGQDEKDDPAKVANDGLDALFAGKDHVVAGSVMNKVQAAMAKHGPQPVSAAMHRKLSEPGSAEK